MTESTNTAPEATDLAVVGCINEEAGEIMEVLGRIVKVAGKITRHGMQATDTHVTGDGQTYDNRADLETECGQLIGAIRFGVRRGLLNPRRLFEEAGAKLAKLSGIHGDGDAAQAPAREFLQELDAPLELPFTVTFAMGYLNGYLENAPEEVLKNWRHIQRFVGSD